MLSKFVFLVVAVISAVSCQINGEFWWLNNNITKLKHGTAPPPTFDDVNELDTDETAKVVFRDSEWKEGKSLRYDDDKLSAIHFRDETELSKPFVFDKMNVNNKVWERPLKQIEVKKNSSSQNTEDEFRFVFPSDDNFIRTDNDREKQPATKENNEESSYKITSTNKFRPQNNIASDDKNHLLPQSICAFIEKSECIRNEGTLYEPWLNPNIKMTIFDTQIVCCILPITTTSMSKIIFPDNYWNNKRPKRSNADNENPALKQRNVLLSRKYSLENQHLKVTTPSTRQRVTQKVVNSDEYPTDPYWNIKNSNIRNPNVPSYQDPDAGSDYESQNYDDYTVELPKPGLIGLYSDHKQTQSTWTQNNNKGFYYDSSDSVEEEEFETSFGYSTIDPRRDRVTAMPLKSFRPRPLKFTAVSSRIPATSLQNPTITFHSNPDFQVLQGFKLLNLMRNKNRFVRKTANVEKDCADNGLREQEKPSKLVNYFDNKYENDLLESNLKQKLFNECGKTQKSHGDCENGLDQGVVDFGDHPWIALVVLTKSEHNIICYATIVHYRVAVSIADCVNGQIAGEFSIIAGVQNLDEDLSQAQRRMATVTLDPNYTSGSLENNLALLHWLRPLRYDARVQPACLGELQRDDNCVFVGWSGYDQEMHSELRWQRASILSPQDCNKRLSKLEVSDALCAAVQSRGTVTGVGGPLLCKNNNRWSAVGVAVWRNDVIIVLPQREWVITNMVSLRIQ